MGGDRSRARLLGPILVLASATILLAVPATAQQGKSLTFAVSGTVKPIHQSVATELAPRFPSLSLDFIAAGSADGFRSLADGTTDVVFASRPIDPAELGRLADDAFVELPVALDGVVLIVPATNDWLESLTLDELKRLWSGEVATWSGLRAGWPERVIERHSYGPASGTVASLLEVLELESLPADTQLHSSTSVLLAAVAASPDAIAPVGLAALATTDLALRPVPIDVGDGPVAPSRETLANAEYPLGRQLWLYVARSALDRPEVARYLDAYLAAVPAAVEAVGFAALPAQIQEQVRARLRDKVTGSVFEGGLSQAAATYGEPPGR